MFTTTAVPLFPGHSYFIKHSRGHFPLREVYVGIAQGEGAGFLVFPFMYLDHML